MAYTISDDLQVQGDLNLQGSKLDLSYGRANTNKRIEIDFNRGESKIYEDVNLHVATDDNLYLDAPGTVFVQNDLNVSGSIEASSFVGNITSPARFTFSGRTIFNGVLGVKDASLRVANNQLTDRMIPNTITVSNYLPLSGGNLSGNLNLGSYVINNISNVRTAGLRTVNLTATGIISLPQNSIMDNMIPNTITASNYLLLSGGTMSGALNMGSQNITNANTITATTFTGNVTGSGTSTLNDLNVTTNIDTATLSTTGDATISGNLGIGTTSPSYALDVVGVVNATGGLKINDVDVATSSDTYWNSGTGGIYYSAGNVGIGTNSPETLLHLSATLGPIIRMSDTGDGTYTNVNAWGSPVSGGQTGFDIHPITAVDDDEAYVRVFRNTDTSNLTAFRVMTGDNTNTWNAQIAGQGGDTYFVALTGNVGIGTTEPLHKLFIYEDSGSVIDTIQTADDTRWALSQGSVGLYDDDIKYQLYQFGENYTTSGRWVQASSLLDAFGSGGLGLSAKHAEGVIRFWTAGNNERMRIDNSGNVGIGTTEPYSMLTIGENIEGVYPDEDVPTITIGSSDTTPALYIGKDTSNYFVLSWNSFDEVSQLDSTGNFFLETEEDVLGSLERKVVIGGVESPVAKFEVNPRVAIGSNADDYTVIKSGVLLRKSTIFGPSPVLTDLYGLYIEAPTLSSVSVTNNYALVTEEDAGNVGIGTISPQSKLQVDGGYLQLDSNTAAPASADCDAAAEEGRMYWDATNDNLYVCSGVSGWRKVTTVAP